METDEEYHNKKSSEPIQRFPVYVCFMIKCLPTNTFICLYMFIINTYIILIFILIKFLYLSYIIVINILFICFIYFYLRIVLILPFLVFINVLNILNCRTFVREWLCALFTINFVWYSYPAEQTSLGQHECPVCFMQV